MLFRSNTDHYSITTAASQDYESFYQQEIMYRKLLLVPPVSNLLSVLVASKDEMRGMLTAEVLKKALEQLKIEGLQILGPASAPIGKVNDVYKKVLNLKHMDYQQLVRAKEGLEQFMNQHSDLRDITVQFDFNPVNGF